MAKYRTTKGDTLKSLAKRYGVKRKTLRELNEDVQFGGAKKKGHKGFQKLDKGTILKLGADVKRKDLDPRNQVRPGQLRRAELLQDPKYAAFLRNFDYDRSMLRSDFAADRAAEYRELDRMGSEWDYQLDENLRGVDRAMANRGVFRSGQRHLERGRSVNDIDRLRQRYRDQMNERILSGQRTRDRGIADLKRARDEERLGARERLTLRDAETEYMA